MQVARTQLPDHQDHRAAIEPMLDRLAASWKAGNGADYAALFTEDCDYITFNGEHQKGRGAVASSHQALFDAHLKGSALVFDSFSVRPLAQDVLSIICNGGSMLKGQTRVPASRRSIQTLTAVRGKDGWRFATFQNSRVFAITPLRAIAMLLGL